MIHRENKEFFCYETYANQMACSQKFKQIEQVIMYPEKKAAVILFLSQLFKNIETETCFSRNVKLAFLDFLIIDSEIKSLWLFFSEYIISCSICLNF